jgi:hypothetical protein
MNGRPPGRACAGSEAPVGTLVFGTREARQFPYASIAESCPAGQLELAVKVART